MMGNVAYAVFSEYGYVLEHLHGVFASLEKAEEMQKVIGWGAWIVRYDLDTGKELEENNTDS